MSLRAVLQVLGQLTQLHRIESGLTASRHSGQPLLASRSHDFSPLMHGLSFNAQLSCYFGLAHS